MAVDLTAWSAPAVERLAGAGPERWRFAGHEVHLHRSEGEGYYLNLVAPEPRVFVMWRMLEPEAIVADGPAAAPFVITLSYNEAARMLDGGERVDSIPLPGELRAWLEPFVAAHYSPAPRKKFRRRDPLAEDIPEPGLPQSEVPR